MKLCKVAVACQKLPKVVDLSPKQGKVAKVPNCSSKWREGGEREERGRDGERDDNTRARGDPR